MNRKIRQMATGLLATAALTGTGLLAPTVPASAGTNGQEVTIYNPSADTSACQINKCWVRVAGYNQNGKFRWTPLSTPTEISYLYNWWWAGWVTIYGYGPGGVAGGHITTNECYVPKVQKGSNWVFCYMSKRS